MSLSPEHNSLFYPACGGLILGLACTLNYVIRGKDTGMTRIAYNIATMNTSQLREMTTILGGMFTMSSIIYLIYGNGNYNGFQPYGPDQDITKWTTLPGYLFAGLLVGFGAKLSGGCTSGHGLSGLPRLSLRSFVAVCMFLLAGISIRTYALYFGLKSMIVPSARPTDLYVYDHRFIAWIVLLIGITLPIFGLIFDIVYNTKYLSTNLIKDSLLVYIIGNIFASGLLISGMSLRKNILHFLQIDSNWNPALLVVMGTAVAVNLRGVSLNGNKVFNPEFKDRIVDWKVVIGGICFGLGWGIGGLCPGPFYVLFAVFTVPIQMIWGIGFVTGSIIGAKITQKPQSTKIEKNIQSPTVKRD